MISSLRKKFKRPWKHEVVYFVFVVVYIYAIIQVLLGLPDTVLDTIIIQILPVYITVEGVLIGLAPQIKTKWLRDAVAVVGFTSMLLAIRTLIVATFQHLQLNQSSVTGTTSGFVLTSFLFLILVELYAFALLIPVSEKEDQKPKDSSLNIAQNEPTESEQRGIVTQDSEPQAKWSALSEEIRLVTNHPRQLETEQQAQRKKIDELQLRPYQASDTKFQPLFERLAELNRDVDGERQKLIALQLASINSYSEQLSKGILTMNDTTKKLVKSSIKLEYFSAILIIATGANIGVALIPLSPYFSLVTIVAALVALSQLWRRGTKQRSKM